MSIGAIGIGVFAEKTPIDGKTTGSTKIVEESDIGVGNKLSPVFVVFETITADAITETAIVSIGTNSPNYDNIIPAHGINPVEGNKENVFLHSAKIIDSGLDIYARVIRAASGTELEFIAGVGVLSYLPT